MKNRLRLVLRNRLGLAGSALALVSVAAILVFTLIGLTSKHSNPYASILAFVIAPAFLLLALTFIAVGYKTEKRKKVEALPYPQLDLNIREQRRGVLGFILLLGVLVVLGATGSYKGYEYTESVSFCGNTCHTVMHPEYTAYQYSSHARVACVDCHVGSGANWYVKSKFSGTRQVFAAALKTYPRPIPTPVHNLRPAPETCEQCHWPRKFYGAQLKVFTHYASDEANTPRRIQMLIQPEAAIQPAAHPRAFTGT